MREEESRASTSGGGEKVSRNDDPAKAAVTRKEAEQGKWPDGERRESEEGCFLKTEDKDKSPTDTEAGVGEAQEGGYSKEGAGSPSLACPPQDTGR
ncbi:hypothetical protein AMTR_s00043p00171420 [Amborella trichopoda]|uniref:Uncharacterized protein n=1 Tax=Amborella trichopoda TaxID=13333 RepID=W1PYZ4_AMBTC|nr:hypothetical protein AMTR_s00043p00171420 [Amborella trichopoda]